MICQSPMLRANALSRRTKPVEVALRLLAVVALVAVLAFGADWLLRAENLPVKSVRFEGPFKHVSRAQLETAVLDAVRGNFLLADLAAIQARVETLPWVHRVSVRRRFPQDIHIIFTEQQLVARWNETAWLNRDGEAVRVSEGPSGDLPRLDGPEGTGAEMLARYTEFNRALAPTGLTVARLTLTPRRSWRVEARTRANDAQRIALVLDRDQPEKKIARFARVYAASLARQAGVIRQVDLRYTNGFSIDWTPTAVVRGGSAHAAVEASELHVFPASGDVGANEG